MSEGAWEYQEMRGKEAILPPLLGLNSANMAATRTFLHTKKKKQQQRECHAVKLAVHVYCGSSRHHTFYMLTFQIKLHASHTTLGGGGGGGGGGGSFKK